MPPARIYWAIQHQYSSYRWNATYIVNESRNLPELRKHAIYQLFFVISFSNSNYYIYFIFASSKPSTKIYYTKHMILQAICNFANRFLPNLFLCASTTPLYYLPSNVTWLGCGQCLPNLKMHKDLLDAWSTRQLLLSQQAMRWLIVIFDGFYLTCNSDFTAFGCLQLNWGDVQ